MLNRINIATGESEKIFEDSNLEIEELYSIDGKLVDEDNDGMYEFVPFEWDGSEIGYDRM